MSEKKPIELVPQAQDQVPDFLRTSPGQTGTEHMDSEDTIVPRLKICQAMTRKAVKEDIADLDNGDLYHTTKKVNYGKSLDIYILFHWRSEVWFSESRALIGTRFRNPNDKNQWITYGSEIDDILEDLKKPAAQRKYTGKLGGTDNHNYMCVRASSIDNNEMPEIFIYSAGSAACKPAKQLNSYLKDKARNGWPIYAHRITLSTVETSFEAGDAWMPSFTWGKTCDDPKQAEILKSLCEEASRLMALEDTHVKGAGETEESEVVNSPAEHPQDDGKNPFDT